jgi:hypothetical protein
MMFLEAGRERENRRSSALLRRRTGGPGERMREVTLDSRRFRERLEVATNMVVITSGLLFGLVLYRSLVGEAKSSTEAPAVGTVLPALPGHEWDGHGRVLLLALRKGCYICEASMPFYREILRAEQTGPSTVRLLGVLPDEESEAARLLRDAQLDIPMVASFPLEQLRVSRTPALILAGGNGRVEKVWLGEQDVAGQKEILQAIRK